MYTSYSKRKLYVSQDSDNNRKCEELTASTAIADHVTVRTTIK